MTDQTAATNSFSPGPNGERYFLKGDFPGSEWVEVSKAKWISAERSVGFRPNLPSFDPLYMKTCATGGFIASNGVMGGITYNGCAPSAGKAA